MIVIFDYGSGNLRSAERAFAATGESVKVTNDLKAAKNSKGLVIPGVGAFGSCMEQLCKAGGDDLINTRVETGAPVFGICVGMQILFSSSDEKGEHPGLGIFKGKISKLDSQILPQIGWNTVSAPENSKLFQKLHNEYFYFVHSFAAKAAEQGAINTFSEYGDSFLAAVEMENIVATQFHPEKSGSAGLQLISNWVSAL